MPLWQIDQNCVVVLLWRRSFYFVKLVPFLLTALLEQALRDPGDVVLWLDGVLADNGDETGDIISCICGRVYVYLHGGQTRPYVSAGTTLQERTTQLAFDFE